MSGRIALFRWTPALAALPGFPADHLPHWNLAPGANLLMLRQGESAGSHQVARARWGLTPAWLTDLSRTPAHARSETLADQPMFREAFRERRCLVPANGFYEWRGARKRPYWITGEASILQLAAIWEAYPVGETIYLSLALVTQAAADLRRPLLLDDAEQQQWLDPRSGDATLRGLLIKPPTALRERALAGIVNDPKVDAPECLTPA
jgi:putative SOS response-associated peptidase YedK